MEHSDNWALSRPAIINWLYLASFVTGITGLIGVVLAFVWKSDADPAGWEHSHFRYHVRTFLLGLLGSIVGALLTLILIGFLILLGVAIWVVIRCVMSLTKAMKGEPMPNPTTFMV